MDDPDGRPRNGIGVSVRPIPGDRGTNVQYRLWGRHSEPFYSRSCDGEHEGSCCRRQRNDAFYDWRSNHDIRSRLGSRGHVVPGDRNFDRRGPSHPRHRDIVWKFGTRGDLPVVGDWNGDGFDEIGVFGKRGGVDVFLLDLDRDGAFNPNVDARVEVSLPGTGSAFPIAGNWDGSADGTDEVGVFKGASWFLDRTGQKYAPVIDEIVLSSISTSMRGFPIVSDWDGDGADNVGMYDQDKFKLDTDEDFGQAELTVLFPEFDFGGLKPQPVAGDWNANGIDDIGLFVRRETGANTGTREAGEWFLDVDTDLTGSGVVEVRFEPPLTGQPNVPFVEQDIFLNFGDERESASPGGLIPVVGNFDPPVRSDDSIRNGYDVNGDGRVSALDALTIINALPRINEGSSVAFASMADMDVSGDFDVTALDALLVINALARQFETSEGESLSPAKPDVIVPTTSRETESVDFLFAEIERRLDQATEKPIATYSETALPDHKVNELRLLETQERSSDDESGNLALIDQIFRAADEVSLN